MAHSPSIHCKQCAAFGRAGSYLWLIEPNDLVLWTLQDTASVITFFSPSAQLQKTVFTDAKTRKTFQCRGVKTIFTRVPMRYACGGFHWCKWARPTSHAKPPCKPKLGYDLPISTIQQLTDHFKTYTPIVCFHHNRNSRASQFIILKSYSVKFCCHIICCCHIIYTIIVGCADSLIVRYVIGVISQF